MSSKKFVPLSADDVIRGVQPVLISHSTFTVEDFMEKLRANLRISDRNSEQFDWLGSGMECQVLRANQNGTGWQTGKIRVHIEFCANSSELTQGETSTPSLDNFRTES